MIVVEECSRNRAAIIEQKTIDTFSQCEALSTTLCRHAN